MTLILTPGGAYSNSFASLSEAADRASAMSYDTTAWDGCSEAEKEDCLILAAEAISRLPLRGKKVNRYIAGTVAGISGRYTAIESMPEQALGFPRTCQFDRTVIPIEVKQCQIDLAITVIAPLYPPKSPSDPDVVQSAQSLSQFQLGPLTIKLSDQTARSDLTFLLSDTALLSNAVVSLRLRKFLTGIRGVIVHDPETKDYEAFDDRIDTVTTTTEEVTTTT
jgi:hypothetical protein